MLIIFNNFNLVLPTNRLEWKVAINGSLEIMFFFNPQLFKIGFVLCGSKERSLPLLLDAFWHFQDL